jgi:nitrite reductase/ring-hydroxylating ferredoxin subunit
VIAAGTYVRDLGASLERLIENALDWEHLPHLHDSDFAAIELVEADESGWAARAQLTGGAWIDLDLRLDADRKGWVTTSRRDGAELSRIESRAEATGRDSCRVSVAFFADVPETAQEATATYYRTLYNRLYDEDEAMMIARAEAIRSGGAGLRTFREAALPSGRMVRIPLACPHLGLPLTAEPDADGVVTCPWHGYRFDVRTGQCVSGQECGWSANLETTSQL